MDEKYGSEFFSRYKEASYISATKILPCVLETFNSKSIVDFGCGIGTWLAAATEIDRNIEILGIDGDYVDKRQLLIEKEAFLSHDLTKELSLQKKYDLAISLEVAEHINKDCANIFIENICKAADVIVFSGALPYQGGLGHINEQLLSHWVHIFEKNHFSKSL